MAEDTQQNTSYEPVAMFKNNLQETLYNNPKCFAESILKSQAVTCSITMPVQAHSLNATICTTTTIPFYMKDDISLGTLSNRWSEMVNMSGDNSITELLNIVNAFQSEAQVALQSEAMSAKVWKGSSFDGFTVNCLFVSTRRKVNPTKIIRLLAASALPDKLRNGEATTSQSVSTVKDGVKNFFTGVGTFLNNVGDGVNAIFKTPTSGFKDGVDSAVDIANKLVDDVGMIAPLYYGVKEGPANQPIIPLKNTTLTLQIGDWFRADELLVESVSNISFSKEVIAPISGQNHRGQGALYDNTPEGSDYGYPVWGACTLKLIPFSMMHKTKFERYFIDHSADSAVDAVIGGLRNTMKDAVNIVEKFKLPK